MAIETVVEPPVLIEYSKFASELASDLYELEFRTRAALTTLAHAEEIDTDRGAGLALSYLLKGIADRIEQFGDFITDSEGAYVLAAAGVDRQGRTAMPSQ